MICYYKCHATLCFVSFPFILTLTLTQKILLLLVILLSHWTKRCKSVKSFSVVAKVIISPLNYSCIRAFVLSEALLLCGSETSQERQVLQQTKITSNYLAHARSMPSMQQSMMANYWATKMLVFRKSFFFFFHFHVKKSNGFSDGMWMHILQAGMLASTLAAQSSVCECGDRKMVMIVHHFDQNQQNIAW